MKICTVICEYSPFHRGHEYLISDLKSRGYAVISLMSGSFTQRGEAAVISKYKRAEAAIRCGADLVLELPFPYCALGATEFAQSGVYIANALSCTDVLAFGSECGNTDIIVETAKNILSDEFGARMSSLAAGENYAKSFSAAYEELFGKSEALAGSNDILGVEYVKTIISLGSSVKPLAIKRTGQSFSGDGDGFISASTAREMIYSGKLDELKNLLPAPSCKILTEEKENGRTAETSRLFLPYAAFFRLSSPDDFDGIAEMNDELAARTCSSARNAKSFDELISLSKTKLYSESRIKRAMLCAFLSVREVSFPSFTVLLGANEVGREILRKIKKGSDFPIITKPADHALFGDKVKEDFDVMSRAEALWTLCLEKPEKAGYHIEFSPYIQ